MDVLGSVRQPSTFRMLIWPEASNAQNSIAAVSADGSTVCVLIRRLNSSVQTLDRIGGPGAAPLARRHAADWRSVRWKGRPLTRDKESPRVSNFIQTRVGHSARSLKGGSPRSAKEEYSHEGLVSPRSAVRSRDLRNDPDLSASNAAWSRTERRWGEGHHLWARAACKPSSGTSRIPSNPACCSSRRLLGRAFSAASLLAVAACPLRPESDRCRSKC